MLSRVGLEHLTLGLPGQPTFEGVVEPRAIGVSCAGVRLWSLYVPNGRGVGSPHYVYKLAFLEATRAHAAQEAEALSDGPLGLLGDFNIAPTDADVWDPAVFNGGTYVSLAERAALEALRTGVGGNGLTDLLPRAPVDPDDARRPRTFWEMRMLGFQKRRGMRLDLALVTRALAARVTDAWVDCRRSSASCAT